MKQSQLRLRLVCLLATPFFLGVATPAAAQDEAADSSESSVIAALSQEALIVDATEIDGLTVAVGTRGIVLLSEDSGVSWRQVAVPTRTLLTGVHFADRQHGWAVGHDAVIIRTTDGGETWERVYFDPERETPLLDVWFADPNNGFAVGAYGLFLRSSDGGVTWEEEPLNTVAAEEEVVADDAAGEEEAIDEEDEDYWEEDFDGPADFHLNKITESGDGRLFISAEAGNIYRSSDRGASWEQLDSGYDGSFFSSLAVGDDSLLAFGLRGSMFRSDDGGASFARVDTPVSVLLNEATQLSDGRIVVVGMSGTILVSDDNAQSFYIVQREDRKALTQVLSVDGDAVLIFGEAGPVRLASEDLGRQ